MPIDYSKYPNNFKDTARKLKDKAGGKCENCGIGNMEDGTMGSCLEIHHPDKDPHNPYARTEVLCAKCHLNADAKLRKGGCFKVKKKIQKKKPKKPARQTAGKKFEMKIEQRLVEELVPYIRNPKDHPPRQVKKIVMSIKN